MGRGFLRSVRNEKGTHCRHGNHDDPHTGLGFDPEGFPRRVDGAVDNSGGGAADDGDDDHEDAEAECCPERQFLAKLDFGLPEEQDGDRDD